MTLPKRFSGVLLHPICLPGPHGIGDLGHSAASFLEFLQETGQTAWQILPLNPIGYGNSPYSSDSAFAGEPLLISLEKMREDGLLEHWDVPHFSPYSVDYGAVWHFKQSLFRVAFDRFQEGNAPSVLKSDYDAFRRENDFWLEDYALFSALKRHHNASWTQWEAPLIHRESKALDSWRDKLARETDFFAFLQFLFFRQWTQLKRSAAEKRISILGDVPIYVSHDSADVWVNQELFKLDKSGQPTSVAGVPPDYFSQTGQRWGNPIYHWDHMKRNGYKWWINRFRQCLKQVDIIRLDHFLGFSAYWEIPVEEQTAMKGKWVPGPGAAFFDAVKKEIGGLPFLAENLGVITPEAEALRRKYGLPGMSILQFSFPPDYPPCHPYNFEANTYAYTGTHDNNTVSGWFHDPKMDPKVKEFVLEYLNTDGRDIHWDFLRFCLSLHTQGAIIPLQDLLGRGSDARMNFPGRSDGNWTWRFQWEELTPILRTRFGMATKLYGRWPVKEKSDLTD